MMWINAIVLFASWSVFSVDHSGAGGVRVRPEAVAEEALLKQGQAAQYLFKNTPCPRKQEKPVTGTYTGLCFRRSAQSSSRGDFTKSVPRVSEADLGAYEKFPETFELKQEFIPSDFSADGTVHGDYGFVFSDDAGNRTVSRDDAECWGYEDDGKNQKQNDLGKIRPWEKMRFKFGKTAAGTPFIVTDSMRSIHLNSKKRSTNGSSEHAPEMVLSHHSLVHAVCVFNLVP